MRRECPQNQGYGSNAWYYPPADMSTEDQQSTRANPPTLGSGAACNILRWQKASPETYMEILIAGHNLVCLLDTGCDHSMIPRRLVP